MGAENIHTMEFLHKLTGRSVTKEFDYEEFSQKPEEERLEVLKSLAQIFELEEQNVDLEGISQIEEEKIVGFLREAFKKYRE